MKLSPDLFHAKSLQYDTRLLFKLKLILGNVCGYGGEVPLTVKDLAERLYEGTSFKPSTHRTKLLLLKLEDDNIIRHDSGKLFFNKFVYVPKTETDPIVKNKLYSRCFKFFTCDAFLNEDRMVQRFVLHFVGKELVYIHNGFTHKKISDLYGIDGLFDLRTRAEMLKVIDKASKYLKLTLKGTSCYIYGVHQQWVDMGEIESEGANLWVRKQLDDHGFINDFICDQVVWQLTKVMESYYKRYDYSYSSRVFSEALSSIAKHLSSALRFRTLLYKDFGSITLAEAEKDSTEFKELNEISAYFKAVMENAELQGAVQLAEDIDQLHTKIQLAERQLFDDQQLSITNQVALIETKESINQKEVKLMDIHRVWLNKFRNALDKTWFYQNWLKISRIHYFIELNRDMQNYQNSLQHYA
jgi:hypothetical protein